jgi:hypothetical protein
VFKSLVEALGGATRNNPPDAIFSSVEHMSQNVWETVNGLMVIFGATIFDRSAQQAKVELLHVAILATAAAGWIIALRSLRTLTLVDQILITAICVNVLAFLFSSMPGPFYTAHEMLVVVPFSAALAARLIVPRLTTLRARLPVYAGLAVSVVLLATTLAGPRNPDRTGAVVAWLKQQNLSMGLSGYWQAASISVQSMSKVQVRAVINDQGHVTPFWQVMRDDWYDPTKHDARFVISYTGEPLTGTIHDLNEVVLNENFGMPKQTVQLGGYVVRVYDYNLLTKLPAQKLPHQQ